MQNALGVWFFGLALWRSFSIGNRMINAGAGHRGVVYGSMRAICDAPATHPRWASSTWFTEHDKLPDVMLYDRAFATARLTTPRRRYILARRLGGDRCRLQQLD
jgi:hypothetical protein